MIFADGFLDKPATYKPLPLPKKLDVSAVDQLVMDMTGMDGDILLDATQVQHLGSLCLQAMISAARSARTRGAAFEIHNCSDAMLTHMRVLGVSPDSLMKGTI